MSRLLSASKRIGFLSPLHRDVFMQSFAPRDVGVSRVRLVPAMIDPAPFDEIPLEERDAIWLGTFERHRGMRSAAEWAEREGVILDMYGFGSPPPYLGLLGHVRLGEGVPPDAVPGLLMKYRRLVTFPLELDGPDCPAYCEACGRVAIEARLAGLEVIHNDRLGAASWPWFKTRNATRAAMLAAPADFWEMIGACIDG